MQQNHQLNYIFCTIVNLRFEYELLIGLFFRNDVLKIKKGIDDGIGTPNPDLLMFLIMSWSVVFLIMIKGKSYWIYISN